MLKYGFKPEHRLDQNFVVDESVIKNIIICLEPKEDKSEIILEIGPGTGSLTKELLKNFKKVIVIEKDQKMVEILEAEFENPNLEIITSDFTKVDLSKLKFDKITGLIPYSISSDIIDKINGIKPTVIVVQKEFAEKLAAYEGYGSYVATSVLAQSYGTIQFIKKVKKGSFYPVPSCDSAIIKITPNGQKVNDTYNTFIRAIFRYPNKNLINSIELTKRSDNKQFREMDASKIKDELKLTKVKQISVKDIKDVYKKIIGK